MVNETSCHLSPSLSVDRMWFQPCDVAASYGNDQDGLWQMTYRSAVLWGLAAGFSLIWMVAAAAVSIALGKVADSYAMGMAMASLLCALLIVPPPALAEEPHDHSLMDPKVDKFLQLWKQPRGGEVRQVSCCNNRDCDEVETRPKNGVVEFKSRVTGQWTPIPPSLLEQNQSDTEWSPNGKAWVCESRVQRHVICATLGDPGI